MADSDRPRVSGDLCWRKIPNETLVRKSRCQRLYAKSGQDKDLMVIFLNGKFHAMHTWCGHMGGPLHEGDIEDIGGSPHVVCPWHGYMFDLKSGRSTIAPELKQEVYETKVEGGDLYIKYTSDLSISPYISTPAVNHSK